MHIVIKKKNSTRQCSCWFGYKREENVIWNGFIIISPQNVHKRLVRQAREKNAFDFDLKNIIRLNSVTLRNYMSCLFRKSASNFKTRTIAILQCSEVSRCGLNSFWTNRMFDQKNVSCDKSSSLNDPSTKYHCASATEMSLLYVKPSKISPFAIAIV